MKNIFPKNDQRNLGGLSAKVLRAIPTDEEVQGGFPLLIDSLRSP